ncbi:MAG: UDP-2,3-diacylglucosamine diphosphatase LpxI [Candidatus Omnitrophica bacterium]|nr:UDP-2,3-diacylglucosamine diphosphatase LpxI [Candidatus Omnitrophota bacterium]
MTKTIGVIAGNGRFPLFVIKEAHRQGYRVVLCAMEKEANPILGKIVETSLWVKVGELGKLVKFFRSEGVHEAMMAGKIEKVRIFQENVRPDFDMMKVLMKIRDFKDDSLLSGIADYLHEQGIDLVDSTMFMRDAFPQVGVLGKRKPSKEVMEDIEFGFQMAKSIAGLDIGQTVVVKKKAVLAVEAIEGTDWTIKRGGELGGGEVTVVKVSKPNQDMRFDVPCVGLGTLRALIRAKAEAFGFEAGKTLFLDQDEFVREADRRKIALVGVRAKS